MIRWTVNILLLLVMLSIEPKDRGTLSQRSPLMFQLPAEFNPNHDKLHLALFSSDQKEIIILTNGLLQLRHIPTNLIGEVVIESKIIMGDGDESETSVFKVKVRRKMTAPEAVPIKLEKDESEASNLEEIKRIRRHKASMTKPPLPEAIATFAVPPPPLPNSTNVSYGEFLSRVNSGRRRSE